MGNAITGVVFACLWVWCGYLYSEVYVGYVCYALAFVFFVLGMHSLWQFMEEQDG